MMSCIVQPVIQQLNKKVVTKHRDRKKMRLELYYYHITGKDIDNDAILSLWLPNGGKSEPDTQTKPVVYDVMTDKNKQHLLKYDKYARSVLLYPSDHAMVSFNRLYNEERSESIAWVGTYPVREDASSASNSRRVPIMPATTG